MREVAIDHHGVKIHARVDGVDSHVAPTVVFANALGTTLHLWQKVIPLLPEGLRIIRYDLRGHGRSDVPAAPYSMGQMVSDAAAVCDAFDVKDALFIGMSVGGMIAQGLAVKRPELIRALVLSNTAAKIGNPALWQDRIAEVRAQGLPALSESIMQRWFGRRVYASPDIASWQAMVSATDPVGYTGVCAAIAGTDFYTPTSGLRIPTLGIAGGHDGETPADLVRETIDLIPGSQFKVMQKCGHLPCAEDPISYAETLTAFMISIGHV